MIDSDLFKQYAAAAKDSFAEAKKLKNHIQESINRLKQNVKKPNLSYLDYTQILFLINRTAGWINHLRSALNYLNSNIVDKLEQFAKANNNENDINKTQKMHHNIGQYIILLDTFVRALLEIEALLKKRKKGIKEHPPASAEEEESDFSKIGKMILIGVAVSVVSGLIISALRD